jgi:RimJ/RimL family protein N-acetyltransferase
MESTSRRPELYAHMTPGPYATEHEFISGFLKDISKKRVDMLTYAIIDKTRPPSKEDDEGALAGMVSYQSVSKINQSAEIGYIIILPAFQGTHVATNAAGILLENALTSTEEGGLGFKRMVWQASSVNEASIRLAEKLGFCREGTLSWYRKVPHGKKKFKIGNGRPLPRDSHIDDVWRDMIVLSHCFDQWQHGGLETVRAAMDRNMPIA